MFHARAPCLDFPAILDKPEVIRQCCGVHQRPSTKSKKGQDGKDPYLLALGKAWPIILRAYHDFKESKPIVEYQVQEKIVLAYPALPYINNLTARTREQTRRHYADAVASGRFMVFVCDRRKRILRSYEFPVEEPEESG